MELQNYLRQHGLERLKAEYSIKSSQDKKYPELICLKYSQIESPMTEKVVQQCRGIVLDSSKGWEVVSYPYDKFFNYGEGHASEIDWQYAQAYEKLDGSLMTIYFYDGKWRVQSSGTSDGSGEVNGFYFTFADLFWQTWEHLGYQLPKADNDSLISHTDYCFIFELMTPYNRVVVQHKSNRLVLHGVRNVETLEESAPAFWAKKYGWECVKVYPLNSWTAIIEAAKHLDPMESEGYIVCDSSFSRVKVKSPQYVAMHHLRESLSPRRMAEIVVANEGEEFLSYFPEWTELHQEVKGKYENLVKEIESTYQWNKSIESQKDFALAIKHLPYSGVLFALRAGKVTNAKEFLASATIQGVERLLGIDKQQEES